MSTLGHVSMKLVLRLLVPIEEHASVGLTESPQLGS